MSDADGPDRAGKAAGWIATRATIVNAKGLHARAAARFVQLAGAFEAEIDVTAKGITVPGRSIMGLMMLAAATGTDIVIRARGSDAAAAVAALAALVAGGFDEA